MVTFHFLWNRSPALPSCKKVRSEKQAQVTCYACGVEGDISTKWPKQQEDKGNIKFGKSSKEKEQEKSLY